MNNNNNNIHLYPLMEKYLRDNAVQIISIHTIEEAEWIAPVAMRFSNNYTVDFMRECFNKKNNIGKILALRFTNSMVNWSDTDFFYHTESDNNISQLTLAELKTIVTGLDIAEQMGVGIKRITNPQSCLVSHMCNYFNTINSEFIVVCETQRQRDILAAICDTSFQYNRTDKTAYRLIGSKYLGYDSPNYYQYNVSYAEMHTFNEWVRKSGYIAPQKIRKQWLKPKVIREIMDSAYLAIKICSVEELTNVQCILYDTLNISVDRNIISQKMYMLWQQHQFHTPILISMYKTGVIDFISPSQYDRYKVLDVAIPVYKPTAPRKTKIAISPPRKQQLHAESAEIVKSLICHTEEVDQNDCCIVTCDQLWELLNAYKTQMFTAYPTEVDGLFIVRHSIMRNFEEHQCLYNPHNLTFTTKEARQQMTPSTILPQASYTHYDGENFTIMEVYCPKTVGYTMFNNQWILGQENDSRELLERWLAL